MRELLYALLHDLDRGLITYARAWESLHAYREMHNHADDGAWSWEESRYLLNCALNTVA